MKSRSATKKPTIQIGPVCDDPAESVSSVNRAFLTGLIDRYDFVAPSSNRRYGTTKQARFNGWNLIYLAKHTLAWLWALIYRRPVVAHYGIASGWALDKGLFFLLLARLSGAKTIGHLHSGDFVDCLNGLSALRRRWAIAQFLKMDAFVVLSEYWRGVVGQYANIPQDRLFVVSNPISGEFEEAALQIPIERPGVSILSLGTMGRDKGVLDIVSAAALVRAQVSDFELILAGPEREPGILDEVMRQIEIYSLVGQFTIHSGVWGNAKLEMFRKASIMLLPSYFENFPLVVLEAAAAGQAIITTPVGAVPEFFEDGISALFVEPGNPEQLARAVIRLLKCHEERNRLGYAAREVFKRKLGRSGIMNSLDQVYSHVLRRRSSVHEPSTRDPASVPAASHPKDDESLRGTRQGSSVSTP